MKKIKLGDLLTIKHGYAFKSEHYLNDGNFALVTLANISESNNFQFDKEKLTYYGASFPQDVILKEGDLILPMTEQVIGLLGNSAFIPAVDGFSFVLNQRVGKVIPSSNVDKYYLHYLLATKEVKTQLEYRASGTKQRNISPENIYDVTVLVPDLPSQKKIGSVLYSLEQKINLNKKINATLESMAKTLYDYWFVQFDFPDENGKPYKTSGGKMIYSPKLGRDIPVGWEIKHVADLTVVKTGKEDANFATVNGKFAYFTCGKDIVRCDVPAFEGHAVLLAGNGDFNVKHYTGKFNAYQRTYVLIPDDEKYYALLYIAIKNVINQLIKNSVGSIVKFITIGDVNSITLLAPKNDSLLKMLNILIYKIEQLQSENCRLAELRDWLLPMLMNGQIKF